VTDGDLPDYPLDELMVLTTKEQVHAVGNLTRFQILQALGTQAATVSQLAEQLGLLKGSVSHHLRILAAAGLIRLVRTRKVRGGTERYWGRAAKSFEVAEENPAYGDRALMLRTVADDLAAASPDSSQQLLVNRLRLSPESYDLLGQRITALVQEFRDLEDDQADPVNLTIALYRPDSVSPQRDTRTQSPAGDLADEASE